MYSNSKDGIEETRLMNKRHKKEMIIFLIFSITVGILVILWECR